ncbi:MAG: hypothetical protein JYX80_02765 [Candidatus Scalindua sediminis]|nr:hypothetical protein [Candidatus Scalindua sediminis]
MTGKRRFSYIFISIVLCASMNVMFSGKVKAGVEDDIAAAVAAGMSYAGGVTDVINAGADAPEAVIAAITLGGPGVAGEVTTAAILAGGIDVASAVITAAIIAGGNVASVVAAAIAAGVDPDTIIAALIAAGVDPDTIIAALIDAGVAPAAAEDAVAKTRPEPPPVFGGTPEQPQANPASASS